MFPEPPRRRRERFGSSQNLPADGAKLSGNPDDLLRRAGSFWSGYWLHIGSSYTMIKSNYKNIMPLKI
jgi:3',5'-cyclic AMP phosphodiesterase CpdA